MRAICLFVILAFIIEGCSNGNNVKETGKAADSSAGKQLSQNEQQQTGPDGFWEKLVMNELRDPNGMVAAIIPFPSSWKIGVLGSSKGGASITGPDGIKVTDFPLRSFMMNYNPALQQSYAAAGQQMRAMPGVDQLVQEDFVPWANGRGLQLVRYYEIPEIDLHIAWFLFSE